MHEHFSKGLIYFTFRSFDDIGLKHGIYTRLGGVSPKPWESLNLGGTVGDNRENVIENRSRLFDSFGSPVSSLFDVWQVHSAEMKFTDSPRLLESPHVKADAISTNKPGITLFMRFADCVPIFLYDPKKRVIAIVHAGWIGTVKEITKKAVETITEKYGSIPADIVAGIGPSIGPDHYEVGLDVVRQVEDVFSDDCKELIASRNGKTYFDLWKANEILLKQSGVHSIEQGNICTTCNTEEWYSHRAEKGKTGRFAALIKLE